MQEVESIEERMAVFKTRILYEHVFWSLIALQTKYVMDESLSHHAATDCARTIWINPEMCMELNSNDYEFVMMHELIHIVFMHGERGQGKDKDSWNIAADYSVNVMLVHEFGYKAPDWVYYDARFLGMMAEEIYDVLIREKPGREKCEAGSGRGNEGQSGGKSTTSENGEGGMNQRMVDVHLPSPSGVEREVKGMISAAYTVWQSAPLNARGEIPACLEAFIRKILKSRVNWERQMSVFSGDMLSREEYTYSPPNRRYLAQDIYVPSLRSRTVGSLVVSIDSSASMTVKVLQVWGNEAAKLSSLVEECVVMVSDTMVHQVIKTRDIPAFLSALRFKGRGGTDHRPVFDKIRELRLEPDLFIGLTDGATWYPEIKPSYPVLWCLTAAGHALPPWGKTIFVDVDE